MKLGHWEYTEEINVYDYYGFIYKITNNITSRAYVGKKQFMTKEGKKYVTSNWMGYTGSSEELNNDIYNLGKNNFKFEILTLVESKDQLAYAEVVEQIKYDVIQAKLSDGSRAFYNRSIIGYSMFNRVGRTWAHNIGQLEVQPVQSSLEVGPIKKYFCINCRDFTTNNDSAFTKHQQICGKEIIKEEVSEIIKNQVIKNYEYIIEWLDDVLINKCATPPIGHEYLTVKRVQLQLNILHLPQEALKEIIEKQINDIQYYIPRNIAFSIDNYGNWNYFIGHRTNKEPDEVTCGLFQNLLNITNNARSNIGITKSIS